MSRGQDKRLRATVVLLGALLVEVWWFRFRVAPDFVELYAEFGGTLPRVTAAVLGWTPYVIALALAPGPLILALRGAEGDRRSGTAAVVIAAALALGLAVFVIWALYQPLYAVSGQVR